MLDVMRRHAKSWIINILIGAICVVFVFWGAGSFRQEKLTKVAEINGEPISMADFQETYRQLYEMARAQYRDLMSDDLLKALNLKRQALEKMINERLMFQQARAMGIKVSNEELQQKIAEAPMFKVDGKFNPDRYRGMLSRLRYSPADYERLVRQDLLSRKIIRMIGGLAKVVPGEVRDYYHLTFDKVDIEFVLFEAAGNRGQVKATDEEIAAYFKKYQEKYRIPPQVKVAYLIFRPEDYEDDVEVGQDEMTEYYELNLDQFREPAKVKARHILFRVNPNASPEKTNAVRAKAETVLNLVNKGGDFAKLAEKYSEGPTAKTGGDLGWFAKDQMVKPFSDAVFKMKKDQISGLVHTEFGFHIIKLDDRRADRNRSYEEVKYEIRKKIIREKTAELAADRATETYEKAGLSGDLKAAAAEMGLTPKTTGFFSANTSLIDQGLPPKFNEIALGLQEGEMGPLVDMDEKHVMIKCLARKESYLPGLEEVRASVKVDFVEEKAMEAASRAASEFLTQVNGGRDWDKLIQEQNLKAGSTGPFTRNETIPKIEVSRGLKDAAFLLVGLGQTGPEPYASDKGYYVIRLKASLPASEEEFEKQKANLKERLEANKSQAYIYYWLESVKADSSIEIEERAL
ncbi:MAG: SurA N-terminal domain-containing protein [Thermodesulfobacteriota bacterium]|nr:SurA N-terminal domain-containing protein [Thermodesulfobacteriota bacterium]